jgi:hypothetical protein
VVREGRFVDETWTTTATYLVGPRGPEYKRGATGDPEWNVYDGLGSVVATVSPDGTVSSSRKFDVYGAERGTPAGGTSHKFVGGLGHTADDTGLVYMRARYYGATRGRLKDCQAGGYRRPDLPFHRQYPTRKRGEVTNRVKPSDNVSCRLRAVA